MQQNKIQRLKEQAIFKNQDDSMPVG